MDVAILVFFFRDFGFGKLTMDQLIIEELNKFLSHIEQFEGN